MASKLVAVACQVADNPCLRVLNGPRSGTRLLIPQGAGVLIGRGYGCHLVLDDKRVSRIHARLWRQGSRVWVQELDALNGLRVDDAPIAGQVALRPGARLGIGRFDLVLEWGREVGPRAGGRQETSTLRTWLPIWIRSALPSSWVLRIRR